MLAINFFIYQSLKIPSNVHIYLFKIFFIFFFFILINIQNQKQIAFNINLEREFIQIYPFFKNLLIQPRKVLQKLYIKKSNYYIPSSLLRLLTIHFFYIVLMKILLLTTMYKDIIIFFFNYIYKYTNFKLYQLNLEIQIAIQFLKIILKEIEKVKITQTSRNISLPKIKKLPQNIMIYNIYLQQLIMNIFENINNISNTLYSKEVHKLNLNTFYQKSKK